MFTKAVVALAVAALASAHMHLDFPPTLKGDNNPHTQGQADPYLNYPYGCCGQEEPGVCRGHLDLLDTDEGKPVVTWAPGQKANFSLSGHSIQNTIENVEGGNHYGGSCQVGFSVDKGKTFKVATTWQGNCPLRNEGEDPSSQVFDFHVPSDLPAGDHVFAWTWVNREKEFFMNCASVTISGSNDDTNSPADPTPTNPPTNSPPKKPDTAQYTLDDCTCQCPTQTFSPSCTCSCAPSSKAKRHLVERRALALHKRALAHTHKLTAPARRAEAVAFNSRPDMLLSLDFAGASCHSQGNPVELEFPDPGPDVVEGDGEYKLGTPSC